MYIQSIYKKIKFEFNLFWHAILHKRFDHLPDDCIDLSLECDDYEKM